MAKQTTLDKLIKAYGQKVEFIEGYLSQYDSDLVRLQRELYNLIIGEYATQFATKDGFIVLNEKNARLLKELDSVLLQFKETFADSVFKGTAESMLELTGLTSDYFRLMNFGKKTIDNIASKLDVLQTTIGINSKGGLIEGSFIDNLAQTPQMKSLLSEYVRTNLQQQTPYKDFTAGFKDIIQGADGVDGALERYSKQFVHDAMYEHSQTVDNFFADELGLDSALYAGDEIKTTRQFCAERAGKVFTREEIESWNDEEWQGKIPGVDVMIQRGGYNCRHNLMWVTGELASQFESLNETE